jgi:hypothetical protein
MATASDTERDLQVLEAELRRLEAEYNMFFAGRLPRPPLESRARVEALIKRYDRSYIQNYGDRFRFSTLQSRYASFVELWDRGMRAREEGRASAFGAPKPAAPRAPAKPADRVVHEAAFRDPSRETSKPVRSVRQSGGRAASDWRRGRSLRGIHRAGPGAGEQENRCVRSRLSSGGEGQKTESYSAGCEREG